MRTASEQQLCYEAAMHISGSHASKQRTEQRVVQVHPAAPYPQPLECAWCLRTGTDLRTEIDGTFACMDLAGCQPVYEARMTSQPDAGRRRLRPVLEGMVEVAQGLPRVAEG